MIQRSFCLALLFFGACFAHIQIKSDFREYSLAWDGQKFDAVFRSEIGKELHGALGVAPNSFGDPVQCTDSPANALCYQWGEDQTLTIYDNNPCYEVVWETTADAVKDCFELGTAQWYGSGERHFQRWPIQKVEHAETAFVTNDVYASAVEYGGVSEPYWLTSDGFAIHAANNTPLFVSLNEGSDGLLCLSAKYQAPYRPPSTNSKMTLRYSVCSSIDARTMHMYSIENFLGKPLAIPDERVLTEPIWSTWAEYKMFINETKVFQYADAIVANGFTYSQIEIDDKWETCYGSHEFDSEKFPDPAGMVSSLKEKGFRVTLWIHPFINENCYAFAEATPYFVHDKDGNVAITSWWQGTRAGIIDFTNPEARDWWVARIESLRTKYGIDSFKFDAGETNWLPDGADFPLVSEIDEPNIYSTAYVHAVAQFGGMAEVRTGWKNQAEAILFRMLDKNSDWSFGLGIKTLIPTLLQFSIVGYPFVLPDMIGGNGYNGQPSKELFIRWLQTNVFMPIIQYSYVPWDYDEETIDICRQFTELHAVHSDYIIQLAQEAVQTGVAINRPVWWIDPNDPEAQQLEDEFLLGDTILVAPVLEEGAVSRDVYLPAGQWRDEADPAHPVYTGPIWLTSYPAPLNVLPYFTRL